MFSKVKAALGGSLKGAVLAVGMSSAAITTSPTFAAVPAEVTTALTDAQADVLTIGGAVLLVAVGAYAIRWLIAQVV